MSAAAPEATGNNSKSGLRATLERRTERIALLLRVFLVVAGVIGGLLLVLATNATIIEISIGTTTDTASGIDTELTGADRHGPALIVIGVFAMAMLAGAVQGARPAMLALAACGVIVLAIAIISDARNIDETGELRQLYTGAASGAGNGFYYETLGGALLLTSGGGLLVLGSGGGKGQTRRRRPLTPREEVVADADVPPAGDRPAVKDWFDD